jgi:hypothetical protein
MTTQKINGGVVRRWQSVRSPWVRLVLCANGHFLYASGPKWRRWSDGTPVKGRLERVQMDPTWEEVEKWDRMRFRREKARRRGLKTATC